MAQLQHARRYAPDDRTLLLRHNPYEEDKNRAYWFCHPSDGREHGTLSTDYAYFGTEEHARSTAKALGWEIVTD